MVFTHTSLRICFSTKPEDPPHDFLSPQETPLQILDTCAAPGSKTVQMLEMLHEGGGLPSGFVVANDSEAQRCHLLVHHTKRMHSPALVVTNHDASAFPLLRPHGEPKVPPERSWPT